MSNQLYAERMADAWSRASDFNKVVPVGTIAKIHSETGSKPIEVIVTSEAFALVDASTQVMLANKSGALFSCAIEKINFADAAMVQA